MKSVLMRPPAIAYSTRARWVNPRLPPSATTLTRRSLPSTRTASLARSSTSSWLSLDALTKVPMPPFHSRSTGAFRMRLMSSVGTSFSSAMPSASRDLRRDRDRLGQPRVDAAALGDQLGVVVRPRRSRQLEQTLALLVALGRVGVGVEEDVTVIESGEELHVTRQQEAVAEDVARHVADAGDREVLVLDVAAHLVEVALHRLPGAARRDAHLLVVVAGRPARGEPVAEPEAVLGRDLVGEIGEGRGALVGGHHQIRIVVVVTHHVGRRHHRRAHDVVGEIEQAADEGAVALDHLGLPGVAIVAGRQPLGDEAALGAHRHDHRVLHHLRLHQARGSRCGSPRDGRRSGCRRARPCRRAGGRPRPAASRRRSRSAGAAAAGTRAGADRA